jgi:hypothetical protein
LVIVVVAQVVVDKAQAAAEVVLAQPGQTAILQILFTAAVMAVQVGLVYQTQLPEHLHSTLVVAEQLAAQVAVLVALVVAVMVATLERLAQQILVAVVAQATTMVVPQAAQA